MSKMSKKIWRKIDHFLTFIFKFLPFSGNLLFQLDSWEFLLPHSFKGCDGDNFDGYEDIVIPDINENDNDNNDVPLSQKISYNPSKFIKSCE